MIASSDPWGPLGLLAPLALLGWAGPCLAQGAPSLPEVPALPTVEAPEVEIPEAPERPDLPSGRAKPLNRVPPGYTGPTQFVLDHRRRIALYPRFGFTQMLGNDTLEAVSHVTTGLDLQLAFNPRVFLGAEAQVYYLSSGAYGLVYTEGLETLERYEEGQVTAYVAVGPGLFTALLDDQEIWSRASARVAYLHPLYLGGVLQVDLERSFLENERRYWVASVTPHLGAVYPLRSGLEDVSANLRILVGAQASVALIFGGGR